MNPLARNDWLFLFGVLTALAMLAVLLAIIHVNNPSRLSYFPPVGVRSHTSSLQAVAGR